VKTLEAELERTRGADGVRLRTRLGEVRRAVFSEKLGEMADEFDAVHSVERALRVGSVHRIIAAARLRPYLVEAVEHGMAGARAGAREGAERETAVGVG
jgi:hypothetical protein